MRNIWEKWKRHYSKLGIDARRICRDGILNEREDEFRAMSRRILFVMKEVDDWEEGDLRKLLKEGPVYQMWHTAARWAAGILHDFPPFKTIDNYKAMKDSLKRVASINLKKTSGGGSSDMPVISAYTHADKKLLLDQIQQIAPNIVLACGTFDCLIWLLNLSVDPDTPYKNPVRDKASGAWIIPWRHPSRACNKDTYAELKKVFSRLPKSTF